MVDLRGRFRAVPGTAFFGRIARDQEVSVRIVVRGIDSDALVSNVSVSPHLAPFVTADWQGTTDEGAVILIDLRNLHGYPSMLLEGTVIVLIHDTKSASEERLWVPVRAVVDGKSSDTAVTRVSPIEQ